ncbi:unnamed protein product [Cylicostephanus goldi]|uniref:Uncharacterized protein n=1 Tax=Cylicostephanus goldi TaxID=71465 RepID=A0A3P7QQN6_CYLGO|nr:unnamed protein product [Cylicostephanus goldi]
MFQRVRIKHSEIREFSFLFEDFDDIVTGETHQEESEGVDTNQQTGVCDCVHICSESPTVKPHENIVYDSIQVNNNGEQTALSAVDEEQSIDPFHKEISAVTLMEQPIPDVDRSLGTSGTSFKTRTAKTSWGQWNGM